MKTQLHILILALIVLSCQKNTKEPANENTQHEQHDNGNYGPYGKYSTWKSVAGDSIFTTNLTLRWYHIQVESPCNIHYYEMSYPLWNCFDQDFSVSECALGNDTLIIKDKDTNKQAIFIKQK